MRLSALFSEYSYLLFWMPSSILTLCMLGNFAFLFCLWIFFFLKIIFFKNNLSGIPSECQTVRIQIRPDILSGLIWVQTVCKGYQLMTKVNTSGERVKIWHYCVFPDGFQLLVHSSRKEGVSEKYFSYFSMKTYPVGTHLKRLLMKEQSDQGLHCLPFP